MITIPVAISFVPLSEICRLLRLSFHWSAILLLDEDQIKHYYHPREVAYQIRI